MEGGRERAESTTEEGGGGAEGEGETHSPLSSEPDMGLIPGP